MHYSQKRWISFLLVMALVFSLLPAAFAEGELAEIALPNGDFETGDTTNWVLTGLTGEILDNTGSAVNKTHVLNLWVSNDEQVAIAADYAVKLTAGTYKFTFEMDGENQDSLLHYAVLAGEQKLFDSESTIVTTGWDNWVSFETGEFTLTADTEITFSVYGTAPMGYWGHLDNLKLFGTGAIYVPPVELTEISIPNGDFEAGTEGWSFVGLDGSVGIDGYAQNNTTNTLSLWVSDDAATELTISYPISLTAGTYRFAFDVSGVESDSNLHYAVLAGEEKLFDSESTIVTTGWDSWATLETGEFTLAETTEVTFYVYGTTPAGYWGNLDNLKLFGTGAVNVPPAELTEISIPNGDFENESANWVLTGLTGEILDNTGSAVNKTHVLNLWVSNDEQVAIAADYAVKLTAGTYKFTFEMDGENQDSLLHYAVLAGEQKLFDSESTIVTTGWDNWVSFETGEFTLTADTEITFSVYGTAPMGYWGHLDNLKLFGTGAIAGPEVEFDHTPTIAVEKVNGVADDDFIRGTDVSSYLSIINSGATYYDYEGNALDEQGFFNLLASAGFNYIRLRVWNDPFDAQGNGYGGGNNDVQAALQMGQWATNAGLKVLIDFHYSDFWADPGKQQTPKAWSGYTVAQKVEAVDAFTYNSLKTLLDGGVNVAMVQVGNETTNSICGESSWTNKAQIFSAGSAAVRRIAAEYNHDILVAIHFTNPERSGNYASQAKNLNDYNVDYDVFASSWYPYWHGTTANLTSVLKNVADTYNKKVMVAETSWAWTLDDGDGHDNTVRKNNNDSNNAYPFSVQGQADELVAATKAITAVGTAGLGVFYWENAWIPVQYAYNEDGTKNEEIVASNKTKWEAFGSGWASSYAAEYDPNDAGKRFGGSAVDNQANFDFQGKALDSLWSWKYMMAGTEEAVEQQIESIESPALVYEQGATLALPTTVQVSYLVGGTANDPVVWNEADVAAVDMNTPGVYTVHGTVTTQLGEREVIATVTVNYPNLLLNPSFELSDMSMYVFENGSRTTDDPHTGSRSFHFYNASGKTVKLEQTITLQPGAYDFSLYTQGDSKGSEDMYIYVNAGDTELGRQAFALAGWAAWQNPQVSFTITEETAITVGLHLTFGAGGWGTIDDLFLGLSPVQPPKPIELKNTISLDGAIGLNYMVAADAVADYTDLRLEVTRQVWDKKTGDYSADVRTLSPLAELYKEAYVQFDYEDIPTMALNDEMTAVLYGTKAGTEEKLAERTYNPIDYCYYIAGNESSNEKLRTVCADLIKFAAAAQIHFSYNTAHMADEKWTAALDAIATQGDAALSGEKVITPLEGQSVTITNYSLDISGRTGINFYVRPDAGQALETLTLEATYEDMKGQTQTVIVPGSQFGPLYNAKVGYLVTVSAMNAAEMQSVVTAVVKDQQGNVVSNSYATSIAAYAKTICDRGTNQSLIPLVKAMVIYGNAARAFFEDTDRAVPVNNLP